MALVIGADKVVDDNDNEDDDEDDDVAALDFLGFLGVALGGCWASIRS